MRSHDATDLLTATEAATFLKLSRRALYMAVRRGELPARRLGRRRLRFRYGDLELLLEPVRLPAAETDRNAIQIDERRPGRGGAQEDVGVSDDPT